MNVLSALGSYFKPQIVAPQVPTQGLTSNGQGRDSLQLPTTADSNNVALSDAGKALAQQNADDTSSLLQRASDFGSATIEAAKKFVANFAESLFGDAAKGMNLSFDSSSISASSSFSSAVQHTESSNGSSDAAALRLEDTSDFLGKGTITTADGHRFSFEVEVHFEQTLEMSASSARSSSPSEGSTFDGPAGDRTGRASNTAHAATREGLATHFPGSVADLFKMFDKGSLHLPFQGPANDNGAAMPRHGHMNLRLLDLLANPDAMAGKLAKTYGDIPSSGQVAEQV